MRQTPANALRVGGLERFTAIDYPGALAAVVFVQGCPWRCVYCHNPQLQPQAVPAAAPTWPEVRAWLARRRGLLDAVVFSGGEPTLAPALPAAAAEVRALGFRVGLHTAGMAPRRLRALLPLVDWVGLDVKAPLAEPALHARVTGARGGAAAAVRESLAALRASGVAFECRTTAHPALLDDAALGALGDELRARGVARFALQRCRPVPGGARDAALPPAPAAYPAPPTLARLRAAFAHFELRGEA
jgi:pyruvate formate lyase activating enzyme